MTDIVKKGISLSNYLVDGDAIRTVLELVDEIERLRVVQEKYDSQVLDPHGNTRREVREYYEKMKTEKPDTGERVTNETP